MNLNPFFREIYRRTGEPSITNHSHDCEQPSASNRKGSDSVDRSRFPFASFRVTWIPFSNSMTDAVRHAVSGRTPTIALACVVSKRYVVLCGIDCIR
jgi:hypothetical protein